MKKQNQVVGFNFDEPVNPYGDRLFLMAVIGLLAWGLLMVFSSSFVMAFETYRDPYFFLRQHLLRLGIGVLLLIFAFKIDYRRFQFFSLIALFIGLAVLVIVLFNGASVHRWLTIGGIRFQPSEFARIALILYLANWCARNASRLKESFTGFLIPLSWVITFTALVMVEPSYSAGLMLLISGLIILILAGAKWWHLVVAGLPVIPAGALLAIAQPYRVKRLLSFMDPHADPLGSNYQAIQSEIAVGSGQLWGIGFGMSGQKSDFLPEAHCDFIFSILCEERGFIGAAIVILLFILFLWRGIRIAMRAPDQFGFLLAGGLTVSVTLFAFVNIAVTVGLLPVTGLPLPFISYGGSALVANLIACGLILNVSRFAIPPGRR
ncbi:putative lipid II flippase FtsW [bacterium]|nr:putative lipid II flippase FtsW [bacterium]